MPHHFETRTWKGAFRGSSNESVRLAMWDDLRRNHIRKGMTKAKVLALMGEPDYKDSTTFCYDIGIEWCSVHLLHFHFDPRGMFTYWEMFQN